ncbi:putative glycogen debranching enzyme [Candidatus Nitrososphaera gargensis Ga9.2]|uniref:Putative glycogen debranching enzyme n=1 Tax=Nitrososphaera gargensis (strain Ga9.2) TaxID=1237085 RepID=K0IJU0_NITGG|nr:amylo-alpha-1,6-glucosidase [Candidatus Nitrososphaera gargensis]AFU58537.1 putative glycogen debranching enzyme [Candidatus Nitrososphaera gargensis Ga9.2]
MQGGEKHQGFIFSLLNPPVPLGGNIIALDIYVDELPIPKKSVFVATQDDVVNAAALSESQPVPFKPFESARFLVIKEGGLDEKKKHKIVIMSKMEGFEQIMIPFTFTDYPGYRSGRIFVPETAQAQEPLVLSEDGMVFKNFTAPLTLSGKKAYIVCSSNGAISANWTWMGVRYDNGGLYVPPVRAFGRIIVEISMDDGVRKRLPHFVVESRHENGILYTRHELAGLEVKRKLLVPFDSRGFIMTLELRPLSGFRALLRRKTAKKRKIRVHFLIDGNITSYGLAAVSQNVVSKFRAKDNCLQLGTVARDIGAQYSGVIGIAPKRLKPSRILTDSYDNDLEMSYDIEVEAGKTIALALVGTGSFTGPESCIKEFRHMRDNYSQLVEDTEKGFAEYSSSTLSARPPPARQNLGLARLLAAYDKAKACLRYLKAEYDGLGEGICAGLPRFPNYWARDTGWTLRGYLAIGDYRFAAATIDNFLRHQAKTTTKAATKGELPMIISGKAFLHTTTYGSADSTFLFPWAIREYVLGTGDIGYLKKRWDSIVDLVNYGFLKDVDGDGLIEHGFTGTAEKLPIQDSTWMDHIDRRKSANDIQALFYESLRIGSELAAMAGDSENEARWSSKAKELQETIDREYWNTSAGFYYDTIRKDGSKDPSIRPNALVLLLSDVVRERSRADSVLSRIEEQDMTTAWGVRTLSSKDQKYQPTLYHDGAVWPLVTGWAAASEIKFGRHEQALRYMGSMAERILHENGMFAETYRGDRPEPFNSCILQAWSVGMYAYALREMMLGMKINMIDNTIQLEPNIPESLKETAVPLDFEHFIPSKDGIARLYVKIDPRNEKIFATFRNSGSKRPEIFSDSYSLSPL